MTQPQVYKIDYFSMHEDYVVRGTKADGSYEYCEVWVRVMGTKVQFRQSEERLREQVLYLLQDAAAFGYSEAQRDMRKALGL